MRIPRQMKARIKIAKGALLFLGSLIIVMAVVDKLERQGNIVSVSTYEVAK